MGTEIYLRVGIDGTGSVTGARVVKRSLQEIADQATLTEKQITSINNSINNIGKGASGVKTVKRDLDSLNTSGKDLKGMLDSIEDRLIRVGISTAVFVALGRAISSVKTITQETLQYLGQIETSTLGIASSFLVSGKFIDNMTGKTLTGQRALTAAQAMSKDVIDQLKVANMQTIATLDQLIVAYQVTLPVAMSKGFNKQMVMDFTLAMVQAAGAIGLPFDQMAEETRSLLTGNITRNSRIAQVLGIRPEDIREYKGNAQGLFDYLMGRLEGFKIAGIESQKTWAGLWSNFKDIAKQGSSYMFQGMFDGIKSGITDMMDSIVKVNAEAKTVTWNPEFVQGAKDLGEKISSLFRSFVSGVKFVWQYREAIGAVLTMLVMYKAAQGAIYVMNLAITRSTEQETAANAVKRQSIVAIYEAETMRLAQAKLLAVAEAERAAMAVRVTQEELARAEFATQGLLLEQRVHNNKIKYMQAEVAMRVAERQSIVATYAMKIRDAELEVAQATRRVLAVEQHLALIAQETAALQAKSVLTKADMAFEKELRFQEFNNKSRLMVLNSELTIAETGLSKVKSAGAAATMAANVAEAEAIALRNAGIKTSALYGIQVLAAKEQEIAARVANRAAMVVENTAMGAQTAAINAASTATRALSVAKGLVGSAVAALGGPLGFIITLLTLGTTAWMLWGNKAKKAADETELGLRGVLNTLKEQNRVLEEQNRMKQGLPKNATEQDKRDILLNDENQKRYNESITKAEQLKIKIAQLGGETKNLNMSTKELAEKGFGEGTTKAISTIGITAINAKDRLKSLRLELAVEQDFQAKVLKEAEKNKRLTDQTYVPNKPKPEAGGDSFVFDLSAYSDMTDQFREAERKAADAFTKATLQDMKDETKLAQLELKSRYDMHLISQTDYLDAKLGLQKIESNRDIMELEDKATRYQDALDKINKSKEFNNGVNPLGDRMATTQAEIEIADTFNKAYLKRYELLTQTTTAWEEVHKAEAKGEQEGITNFDEKTKAIESQVKALQDLKKATTSLQLNNDSFDASQIGTSNETGAVTDPYANEMAKIQENHAKKLALLQEEQDKLALAQSQKVMWSEEWTEIEIQKSMLRTQAANIEISKKQALAALEKSEYSKMYNSLADMASKTFPKITSFQKLAHLMGKEYAKQETGEVIKGQKQYELSTKGKMQMTADYTGFAGEALSNLAEMQDQSSRAGFENAKAFNMGAAIMSTASAIIGQLSGPDAWTPAAWARAAIAGVLGAVQIAKIASTSYGGGGGAVSNIPSGSFGGSGGGAGATGAGIGAPINTLADSKTEEQLVAIASNMENASLALIKVADGLTKVSDLFKDGSFMSLASGSAPNISAATSDPSKVGILKGMVDMNPMRSLNPIGFANAVGSTLFGWGNKWQQTGGGISVGLNGGNVTMQNFINEVKKGGWFTSDKRRTTYSAGDPEFTAVLQTAINQITSTISRGAVAMNTRSSFGNAYLPTMDIATAGRKPEDIAKDLETWLNNASNALAKTVDGLQFFAFYGENAFDALVRLSTALQSTNEKFELIGVSFISSSLSGANAAYKLQQMMGGAEKFAEKVDAYFGAMFTTQQQEAAKAAQATRQVNVAFREMGIAVPATKEEFVKLVNSLTVANAEGAQTFGALMDISVAFGLMQDQLDALREKTRTFNNDIYARELTLMGVSTEMFELRIKHEDELKQATLDGMDIQKLQILQTKEWAATVTKLTGVVTTNITSTIEAAKKLALDLIDAQTAIINAAKTIMTGPLAQLTPEAAYLQAKSIFSGLQAKLAANPQDLVSLKALPDAANALLNASKSYNASGVDYQTDLKTVLDQLNLSGGTPEDSTIEILNEQLIRLTAIKDAVNNNNTDNVAALTSLLGPNSTLATIIGAWSDDTALALQGKREEAFSQSWEKLQPLMAAISEQTTAKADLLSNQVGYIKDPNTPWLQITTDKRIETEANLKKEQQSLIGYESNLTTASRRLAEVNNALTWATGQTRDIYLAAKTSAESWITTAQTGITTTNANITTYQNMLKTDDANIALANQLPNTLTLYRDMYAIMNNLAASFIDPSSSATSLQAVIATSIATWLTEVGPLPSFAVGTDYVSRDMTANIHEGEMIIDQRSAQVLRKYGIQANASADNAATVAELKETNKQLAASVRVLQAGFSRLISVNEQQAQSSKVIEQKTKQAANQ